MRLVMIFIIFSSRDEKRNAAREKSEVCYMNRQVGSDAVSTAEVLNFQQRWMYRDSAGRDTLLTYLTILSAMSWVLTINVPANYITQYITM